jgi:hypothetical protein
MLQNLPYECNNSLEKAQWIYPIESQNEQWIMA